jgi:hypothetical protein
MTRKKTAEIELSPECAEAYERLVDLASRLAAMLTGDPACPDTGIADSARSHALAMGMVYFLLRCDPRDIEAVFSGEGSLAQFDWKPYPAGFTMEPLFARLL